MNQTQIAKRLINELESDMDLGELDAWSLLDIMACIGVSFKEGGGEASAAYLAEASRIARHQ